MFFQIAREAILLLVNNIHEKQKKFRVSYIFICSQSSAIRMRNFKPHVYGVVIAKTEVRETCTCYKYT